MGSTTVKGVGTDEALALDSGPSHMMSTSTMNNQGKYMVEFVEDLRLLI
jgi:hypothetical protein